jgi:hypothetical protein
MEAIRETQKKYCSRAMITAILVAIVFILAGQKGVGKGLVLGTLFSVFNFILMGETLPMRIGKSKGATFMLSFGSVAIRYVLMAVPLVMAIKMDGFNLFASIAGIFMVQLIILAEHFYRFVRPSQG